jgi:hypothetical protein
VTYGLPEDARRKVVQEFQKTGYGYLPEHLLLLRQSF